MAISLSKEILCRPCFSITSSILSLNTKSTRNVKSCWTYLTTDTHMHTHKHTHTHTCLLCSGNNLQPQSWSCPTAHWGSVEPTRCPSTRRLDPRGSVDVGSCDERVAHPSRNRGNRRRNSGGSLGSDWQQRRKLQVPHPGSKQDADIRKSCIIF